MHKLLTLVEADPDQLRQIAAWANKYLETSYLTIQGLMSGETFILAVAKDQFSEHVEFEFDKILIANSEKVILFSHDLGVWNRLYLTFKSQFTIPGRDADSDRLYDIINAEAIKHGMLFVTKDNGQYTNYILSGTIPITVDLLEEITAEMNIAGIESLSLLYSYLSEIVP